MGTKSAVVSGLDINVYKKQDNRNTYYEVLFISLVGPNFVDTVSKRNIHSNCSGWQTFHINPKKLKDLQVKLNSTTQNDETNYILNVTMTIVVLMKEENQMDERILSCGEIASLFVLDKTPVVSPRKEEPTPNSLDTEDKDDAASSFELTNKDTHTKTKPTGSGENVSSEMVVENSNNELSLVPDSEEEEEILDVEVLVPIATLFIDDIDVFSLLRGKRDASEEPMSGDSMLTTDEELCELREKNASFDDPTILSPTSFKQHCCVTPPLLSSRGQWCIPSTFESMYVLRQYHHGLSIEILPDVLVTGCKIITNHTVPSCELQRRVVILQEYFNVSTILAPHTADIHQCVLSPSAGFEALQCVPATYTDIHVLIQTENELRIYALPNIIVASCKLVTKEDELLVITEDNSEPTTVIPPNEKETEKENKDVEKTTAITATTDKQHNETNNVCELRDKLVDLREHLHPSILAPRYVNIKECAFSVSNGNTDVKCIAATYDTLHVLLQNNMQRVIIEVLTNIVVRSCKVMMVAPDEGEYDENSKTDDEGKKSTESEDEEATSSYVTCELQDRVVNVTEYLNDSSIIEPQTFNIHQCSPSTNEQCPQCEPLYGRLEVLKQMYNRNLNRYERIIRAIPNIVATGCRRNPHC